jgi:(R,R)-butanediol dehydrogenase/meso-butanediol dehydrogenase/diacetyl reductase/L-iditol 2-dehydrogenase
MKVLNCIKVGNMKDPDPEKRGRVGILDMPCPPLGDEDVKIKVAYCSICGSDPHTVQGAFGRPAPFGMGHEMSGVIVELGKKATRKGLKVGDRVAGNFLAFCGTCYYCRNGQEQFCTGLRSAPAMAEYVIWHESQIVKLPDDVSLKLGCLLEPLSIGIRIIDKSNAKVGQRVAVSGGGPIGLIALQLFNMYGATSLTLIEPNPLRRELAKKYGAKYIIDPMTQDVVAEGKKITGGLGYDIVVDASGAPSAAEKAIDLVSRGGTMMYVAMYPNEYNMPLNLYTHCYRDELTITGTFVAPYAFPRAAQMLSRVELGDFIDTVYPLDQPEEAFAAHLTGKHNKVLIHCNEDLI